MQGSLEYVEVSCPMSRSHFDMPRSLAFNCHSISSLSDISRSLFDMSGCLAVWRRALGKTVDTRTCTLSHTHPLSLSLPLSRSHFLSPSQAVGRWALGKTIETCALLKHALSFHLSLSCTYTHIHARAHTHTYIHTHIHTNA